MPDFLVVCFLPSGFRVANRIHFLNEHYFCRFIALLDLTAPETVLLPSRIIALLGRAQKFLSTNMYLISNFDGRRNFCAPSIFCTARKDTKIPVDHLVFDVKIYWTPKFLLLKRIFALFGRTLKFLWAILYMK